MAVRIEINNRQSALNIDEQAWRELLVALFDDEGISKGEVSVAVVNDEEMHGLNRRYLEHDYPTDVLSFVLERHGATLNGEIIVSADTATVRSGEFGCTALQELTLYLVHGALHLAGYRDKRPDEIAAMRAREAHYLQRYG